MQSVYTVTQVNSYIKNMFTQDFMLQRICVKGEVSNCKYHSSGHIYFTLKDQKGTIACVMFAGSRSGLAFEMQEGQQVIVTGTVDIYERDGKYQLYAREITRDGVGALYEKFEKLKRDLTEQGLFDPHYKRPIPLYIKSLGIVTAPTGAAVRDIISIAQRRNPYVQILLYPAIVQGEAAAASIVNGIRALEAEMVDVMIVGRGGGSIEDLWAFNEEIVAQAIFDSSIPIISAVGHETDFTIADFVADLRAPTPSAAAELAVYEADKLEEKLKQYSELLKRSMYRKIEQKQQEMKQAKLRLQYLSPQSLIREKKTDLLRLEEILSDSMQNVLYRKKQKMAIYVERFKGLSPLEKLNQGYAYLSTEDGHNITDVDLVSIGEQLKIQVKNGELQAKVLQKEKHGW